MRRRGRRSPDVRAELLNVARAPSPQRRTDEAADHHSTDGDGVAWRFEIVAWTDPQALPRIIGFFAQFSLTPLYLMVQMEGDTTACTAVVQGLGSHRAEMLSGKLRECFLVRTVQLTSIEAPSMLSRET